MIIGVHFSCKYFCGAVSQFFSMFISSEISCDLIANIKYEPTLQNVHDEKPVVRQHNNPSSKLVSGPLHKSQKESPNCRGPTENISRFHLKLILFYIVLPMIYSTHAYQTKRHTCTRMSENKN